MRKLAPAFVILAFVLATAVTVNAHVHPQATALTTMESAAALTENSPVYELHNPDKVIVTTVPIAVRVKETVDSVTHTTDFLPLPIAGDSEPAKGWFIQEEGSPPVFYLDHGTVYVVHKKDPAGGAVPNDEDTRPRVRTPRVSTAGKGTIFICQVKNNSEMHVDVLEDCSVTAQLVTEVQQLTPNHFCTVDETGHISTPRQTDNDPAAEKLVTDTTEVAHNFGLDTP